MFSTFKPVIYIQVSPERVTLRNVKSGSSISEVPEIAVSSTAGPKARSAAFSQPPNVVNPFAHPRSMVSDFAAAEQVLKQQLRRVLGSSLLSIAPRVVIHPLGDPAGGFTQIELRAFREMALGAGASEVRVWTGRSLTDQEVLSKQLPTTGGKWE